MLYILYIYIKQSLRLPTFEGYHAIPEVLT